ncbi:MAG: hypothetical protein LBP94_07650 [Zoogloeaceae bacterium]|jgi:hypothetical protein|nr:hypothetical protein [Zoogloeaceae bacterium]
MNNYLLLLLEVFASICFSLVVLFIFSGPLANMLRMTCPEERAVTFWLNYTRIMLTLTPLLFVLIASLFARFNNPLNNVLLIAIAALGGLLLGLKMIGTRLSDFAAKSGQAGKTS